MCVCVHVCACVSVCWLLECVQVNISAYLFPLRVQLRKERSAKLGTKLVLCGMLPFKVLCAIRTGASKAGGSVVLVHPKFPVNSSRHE